jgi:hypothetical protein
MGAKLTASPRVTASTAPAMPALMANVFPGFFTTAPSQGIKTQNISANERLITASSDQ